MKRPTLRTIAGAVAMAALLAGAASANAATRGAPTLPSRDGDLARDFSAVDRNTVWNQVDKIKLNFPTYHTEGLAITPDHLFLSSVQIIEPTQKYPSPVGGYDRTPGRGLGHLFVMDRQGHLQKDITLGEGDMYHPGGISYDGTNVWVPVAQYRPNSSAIIYRVNAQTLGVTKQFEVKDHIGGIVLTRPPGTWSATAGVRVASMTGRCRASRCAPGTTPASSPTTRTASTFPRPR